MSGSATPPPGLPPTQFEALAHRVGYGAWCGTSRMDRALLVRNWQVTPGELPGWSVTRRRRIAAPGRPPVVQVQVAADGEPGKVVRAEVYQAPSLASAHALLIELLGGYQILPDMRPGGGAFGDVAFALPGGRSVLFARGNLVFVVNSIGTTPVQASEIAQIFDAHLVAPPPGPRAPVAPAMAPRMRFAAAGDAAAPRARARAAPPPGPVAASRGEGGAPMLKVFARGASLALGEDDEVLVTPGTGAADAAPEVEAFLIDAAGGAARVAPPAGPAPGEMGEHEGGDDSTGGTPPPPAGGGRPRRRPQPD